MFLKCFFNIKNFVNWCQNTRSTLSLFPPTSLLGPVVAASGGNRVRMAPVAAGSQAHLGPPRWCAAQCTPRDGLSEAQAPGEPFALFHQWFADAVKTEQPPVEANAMTLATVDQEGRPHCRILLLKGLDAQGFTFFTNYQSAKGQQLAARPFAAMTFFWPTLERQVRIEGRVVKVTPEESDAYFQVRPLGSRLGAWASAQSQVIRDREELQELLKATEQRFSDTQPDCPEHWGGYRLLPERIEFWQGRASRLHDRLNYRLQDAQWTRERLAP
jgi:pyridoxamine 5'-phosphate oxidase